MVDEWSLRLHYSMAPSLNLNGTNVSATPTGSGLGAELLTVHCDVGVKQSPFTLI